MDTRQYARLQAKPLPPIKKLIRAVLHSLGVPITEAQTSEASLMLWRPILAARQSNYRASVRYLKDMELPVAIPPIHNYPYAAVTSTLTRAVEGIRVNGEPVTEDNRTDTRIIEASRTSIEGPIVRQVLSPSRETIADIGNDEKQPHYGWARVLVGPSSCAFCAMLASREPSYDSEASAIGRGGYGLGNWHAPPQGGICDCIAVMVEDGQPWEGQAAQEKLDDLWKQHRSLKAFRGAWDKQVKAGETEQYLPPSVQ